MGVREIDQFLKQWQMDGRDLHRRLILAPTPRERERWHAIWLLAQGWTASGAAQALGRDPHTIGRWAAAFPGCPNRQSRVVTEGSFRPRSGGKCSIAHCREWFLLGVRLWFFPVGVRGWLSPCARFRAFA
jgi:hypothetical protein